jgi:hypothetical protein
VSCELVLVSIVMNCVGYAGFMYVGSPSREGKIGSSKKLLYKGPCVSQGGPI